MPENLLPIDLIYPPTPFRANGKQNLVFETLIINPTERSLALTGVKISSTQGPLEDWDREETARNSLYRNMRDPAAKCERLDPGNIALLYYWLAFEEDAVSIPPALSVAVRLEDSAGQAESLNVEVPVQQVAPRVILPPVHGSGWLAGEAATNFTGHRRTPIPFDGVLYFAQRYAVDWLQFDADGRMFAGAAEKNESWFCYGADVCAVADGGIIEVQDGIIENVPLSEERAVAINIQSAPGNYVVQDLGGGQYAVYAHLQPGSPTVRAGDAVKAGQVLGKLGNSGNSDAPHLHFHIGNRPAALAMQGLPYHFAEYERLGNVGTLEDLMALLEKGDCWKPAGAPEIRRNEYMGSNDVLNLP